MTRSIRRAGSSLTEVLVALFIMAAGMTALLTLFPLGAMQISQSLKDDRTAQTAAQADAMMRTYWRANMVESDYDQVLPTAMSNPTNPTPPNPSSPPGATTPPLVGPILTLQTPTPVTMPPLSAANDAQPSYPVLVDPLGYLARGNSERFWVAQQSLPGSPTLLPRRNLGFLRNTTLAPSPPNPVAYTFLPFTSADAFANCSMTDDLTYDTNGEVSYARPSPATPAGITRQGRYNWAAIVQRPRNGTTTTAKLTILVFDNRPPLLAVKGDEAVGAPATWPVGTRDLQITVPIRTPDQPVLIRRGGWIMDGTIYPASNVRNANFYRVVGVTEVSSTATATTYNLDLETSIKSDFGVVPPANRQVYLFASLSEVFEREILTSDSPVQP